MAELGVAALSHVPSGERVRTGSADPSGAWDQDHPPSTATTTQESGLRENRTSRLSERTEEGRQPDLLRLYSGEADEQRRATVRGVGGAKGGGRGERGPGPHAPGSGPGKRINGTGPRTACFAVSNPRWEPSARIGPARIWCSEAKPRPV